MKTIVALFAHPDDEAFGPAGTLATLAKDNNVYILCATKGEAGGNHGDNQEDAIGNIRAQELRESAAILGVKEVRFLDFADGTLCNNVYHKLADVIKMHLDELKPTTLLTYEPRGISGHIDHIVMSMVTSYLFERLDYVTKLMYYCMHEDRRKTMGSYFIYVPPGYKDSEINEIYDVKPVWDQKLAAMRKHHSQKKDCERILEQSKNLPKKEYFLTRTK